MRVPVSAERLAFPRFDRMAPRVVILSGNNLCHNPRVVKEADALDSAGFSVSVLGAWIERNLAERDRSLMADRSWRYIPVVDLTANSLSTKARHQQLRVRAKAGRMLGRWLHFENRWQLGYCGPELLQFARRQSAGLFIAHSEQALWAVDQLRRNGARVGVDMEDWFSEDLLPEARQGRPLRLLRMLESELLSMGTHCTTTSKVMSNALADQFGCRPPIAVYNAFPWSDRSRLDPMKKDRRDPAVPSLHWYSQTIGPGRGLEELIAALPLLRTKCEIHLRGRMAGGNSWLDSSIPAEWRARVFFHDLVSNDELLSRIAEHDIGFAGEQQYCRSRDLTVTNKILQYMLAGLAVVASDTAGQREVASLSPGAVALYRVGDVADLAKQLDGLLGDRQRLAKAKAAALCGAETTFCWERIAPILVRSVGASLAR